MITEAQFNLLRRMADQGLQADMDVVMGANVLAALLDEIAAAHALIEEARYAASHDCEEPTYVLTTALDAYDTATGRAQL